MNPARRPIHQHTYEAYLEYESGSSLKHEFFEGEIYAMAGGSRQHAALAMSIGAACHAQLRDKPCVVHSSDLKIRVVASELTTYPDVTIICGPPEPEEEEDALHRHVVLNPTVLVEVTSPSSEAWDRGEKLEHYKKIPSLRSVVLVSHRELRIDVSERRPDGSWTASMAGPGEAVDLTSIGCRLLVDEIYRNVGP